MKIETSTLMMIFFIISLIVSISKIYAFLPNEQLADDDTTKESQEELLNLMLQVIKNSDGKLSVDALFERIVNHKEFDSSHYWRFNLNRLNQLLQQYYLKNRSINSIADIYQDLKA